MSCLSEPERPHPPWPVQSRILFEFGLRQTMRLSNLFELRQLHLKGSGRCGDTLQDGSTLAYALDQLRNKVASQGSPSPRLTSDSQLLSRQIIAIRFSIDQHNQDLFERAANRLPCNFDSPVRCLLQ